MDLEWDEKKRLSNLAKHRLDFADVLTLLSGPNATESASIVGGEERLASTGMLDDVFVTAIYTWRGSKVRVISFRRARDGERRRYQKLYGS